MKTSVKKETIETGPEGGKEEGALRKKRATGNHTGEMNSLARPDFEPPWLSPQDG